MRHLLSLGIGGYLTCASPTDCAVDTPTRSAVFQEDNIEPPDELVRKYSAEGMQTAS